MLRWQLVDNSKGITKDYAAPLGTIQTVAQKTSLSLRPCVLVLGYFEPHFFKVLVSPTHLETHAWRLDSTARLGLRQGLTRHWIARLPESLSLAQRPSTERAPHTQFMLPVWHCMTTLNVLPSGVGCSTSILNHNVHNTTQDHTQLSTHLRVQVLLFSVQFCQPVSCVQSRSRLTLRRIPLKVYSAKVGVLLHYLTRVAHLVSTHPLSSISLQ